MPDELTMLRKLGAAERLSPEIEQRLRRELLDRIAAPPPRPRGRWPARAALAAAVAVVVAAAGLLTERGGEPSVAARAYAAITLRAGIMHFVTDYGPGVNAMRDQRAYPPYYQEYWIDLAHPRRQRVVQSYNGSVVIQTVFVDHVVRGNSTRLYRDPPTDIIRATRDPRVMYPGGDVRAGQDPMVAYRDLLQTGNVLSESQITYDGRDAYKLEIQYKPPYDLVDDVWTGDRQTYIVDRHTYFPLESTFQMDPVMGGGVTVTRFPVFEILPASAKTRALLQPVRHPAPYRP